MVQRKKKGANGDGMSLFDVLETETVKVEGAAACRHGRERRSETVWKGESCVRLTMTCETCGRIRGRFPGE